MTADRVSFLLPDDFPAQVKGAKNDGLIDCSGQQRMVSGIHWQAVFFANENTTMGCDTGVPLGVFALVKPVQYFKPPCRFARGPRRSIGEVHHSGNYIGCHIFFW